MKRPDVLVEFEKPEKNPWEFKSLIVSIPVIVCIYFFILFDDLKLTYIYGKSFWNWQTYRYSLALLYPLIGLQGYMLTKKYGWFILSHYLLISTVFVFFISVYSLFEGPVFIKKLLFLLIIVFLNAGSLYVIFKRKILQIFNITKEDKLLFVLLIIVFVILNAVVWTVS